MRMDADRLLSSIITESQMEFRLPLQPGTLAVVHNHRVMHGRTAFTGTRGLCGCYIGDDEFRSTIRQLALQAQSEGEERTSNGDAWNLLLAEGLGAGLTPPARVRY